MKQGSPGTSSPRPETRAAILRLVRDDPTLPGAEIARAVGVSTQRVHEILRDSGYQLQRRWVRVRRRS